MGHYKIYGLIEILLLFYNIYNANVLRKNSSA